jgi:hypothetical protein
MGDERLPSGACDADVDWRRARRRARQRADAGDRLHYVRRGVSCLCPGAVGRLADRCARHPGHRGGPADPGEPCADRRHLSEGRTRRGNRRVGGGGGAHLRRGPRRRRLVDRSVWLASCILDQSATCDSRSHLAVGVRARGPQRAASLRFRRRNPDRSVTRGTDLELKSNRPQRASRSERPRSRHWGSPPAVSASPALGSTSRGSG